MRSLCPLPRTGRLVFKLDQIVFENKPYLEYMSFMGERGYPFLDVPDRSDSGYIGLQRYRSGHGTTERLYLDFAVIEDREMHLAISRGMTLICHRDDIHGARSCAEYSITA